MCCCNILLLFNFPGRVAFLYTDRIGMMAKTMKTNKQLIIFINLINVLNFFKQPTVTSSNCYICPTNRPKPGHTNFITKNEKINKNSVYWLFVVALYETTTQAFVNYPLGIYYFGYLSLFLCCFFLPVLFWFGCPTGNSEL